MTRSVAGSVRFRRLLFCCFVVAVAGCGSSEVELAPVQGRVTLDGQPVRGVFIIFQPPTGKPSYAMLDADGEFELQYNVKHAGSIVGRQEVFLRPPGSDELGDFPEGVKEPTSIPDRYRQPFQTVDVTDDNNEFTFELTSNGA